MVGLAMVLFVFLCSAFASLQRSDAPYYVLVGLYRGLIFGDGDGLDAMDLKAADPPAAEEQRVLVYIMFMASVLFYVIILNLLIAVYSNEYDRVEKLAESIFIQERAKACCKYLFSLQKLRFSTEQDRQVVWYGKRLAPATYALTLGLCLAWPGNIAALALALTQVAWQALWMQSSWFQAEGSRSKAERNQDLFLWICHRSDYDEERISFDAQTRDVERASEALLKSLQGVSQALNTQVEHVEQRLESVEHRFGRKLERSLERFGERGETRHRALAEKAEAQLRELSEKTDRRLAELLQTGEGGGASGAGSPSRYTPPVRHGPHPSVVVRALPAAVMRGSGPSAPHLLSGERRAVTPGLPPGAVRAPGPGSGSPSPSRDWL